MKLTNYDLFTIGDFIDLYYIIKKRGSKFLQSKLSSTSASRIESKWNAENLGQSDFWNIPSVQRRWNKIISGDSNKGLHPYVYNKYLTEINNIKMLSVGCGEGYHERQFAIYQNFELIKGIDVSQNRINEAISLAKLNNFNNLKYNNISLDDFHPKNKYDVVLFHSSLHHFSEVNHTLIHQILPLLNHNGLLVVYEYCGNNRLRIDKLTLQEINRLLKHIPAFYRQRILSNKIKKKVYSPGLLRMKLNDPSEAIDSESILSSLHRHFSIIEEKNLGWNILMPLLKDIAHNFYDDSEEANEILEKLFQAEDNFIFSTGKSDAIFGVYKVKK
jgi:2-polyprenyl-3-methyl-5-hydroxy-6-metoxy-1,4-benzoquinol methylase